VFDEAVGDFGGVGIGLGRRFHGTATCSLRPALQAAGR
jgi:hypothetical protein